MEGAKRGINRFSLGLLFVCHGLHVAIASPNDKPWVGGCFLAPFSTVHESQIGFADVGLVVRTAGGSSAYRLPRRSGQKRAGCMRPETGSSGAAY